MRTGCLHPEFVQLFIQFFNDLIPGFPVKSGADENHPVAHPFFHFDYPWLRFFASPFEAQGKLSMTIEGWKDDMGLATALDAGQRPASFSPADAG